MNTDILKEVIITSVSANNRESAKFLRVINELSKFVDIALAVPNTQHELYKDYNVKKIEGSTVSINDARFNAQEYALSLPNKKIWIDIDDNCVLATYNPEESPRFHDKATPEHYLEAIVHLANEMKDENYDFLGCHMRFFASPWFANPKTQYAFKDCERYACSYKVYVSNLETMRKYPDIRYKKIGYNIREDYYFQYQFWKNGLVMGKSNKVVQQSGKVHKENVETEKTKYESKYPRMFYNTLALLSPCHILVNTKAAYNLIKRRLERQGYFMAAGNYHDYRFDKDFTFDTSVYKDFDEWYKKTLWDFMGGEITLEETITQEENHTNVPKKKLNKWLK